MSTEFEFDSKVKEADDIDIKDYSFSPTLLENGVIDYSNIEHDKIFLVNKHDILEKEKPDWIPELDLTGLKDDEFLPKTIKSSDGYYYVQTRKFIGMELSDPIKLTSRERSLSGQKSIQVQENKYETTIYKMPADILAITLDYYIKKQKAINKEAGIKETVGLPRKTKSMLSTRYNDMVDLLQYVPEYKENEAISKHYPNRSKSEAYRKQNKIIFDQYNELLQNLKDKLLDLNLDKIDYGNAYTKGEITSYGDTGLSNSLYEDYGVKIKKQNGSTFSLEQKNRVESVLKDTYSYYGDLTNISKDFHLKVSYADNCYQHARKFIGLFSPFHNAIGVSFFDDNTYERTTAAHEFAHFLDYIKGNEFSYRYASDKDGSLENQIATKYKKLIREQNKNNKSKVGESKTIILGDYLYRTCECFARAMEQDFELTIGLKEKCEPPAYLPEEIFKKEIKPLIEELKKENEIKLNLIPKNFVTWTTKNENKMKEELKEQEKENMSDVFDNKIENNEEYANELADWIIQESLECSVNKENYHISFEDIVEKTNTPIEWLNQNYKLVNEALAKHNDNELFEYNPKESNENEFNLNFCSNATENDGNTLFKQNKQGRWVRKTEEELEQELKNNTKTIENTELNPATYISFEKNEKTMEKDIYMNNFGVEDKENIEINTENQQAIKDSEFLRETYGNKKAVDSAVKKVSITDFCSKDENKHFLEGIFYENGFAIATNGKILIKQKTIYPEEYEGKIIDPKTGKEIEGQFPNYKKVFPKKENLIDRSDRLANISNYLSSATTAVALTKKQKHSPVCVDFGGTYVAGDRLQLALAFAREKGFNKVYQEDNYTLETKDVLDENGQNIYKYYIDEPVDDGVNFKYKYYSYEELPEEIKTLVAQKKDNLLEEAKKFGNVYISDKDDGNYWCFGKVEEFVREVDNGKHLNRVIEFDAPDGSSILIMPHTDKSLEMHIDNNGILNNYEDDLNVKSMLLGKGEDFYKNIVRTLLSNEYKASDIDSLFKNNLEKANKAQNDISFPKDKKDCLLYAAILTYADAIGENFDRNNILFEEGQSTSTFEQFIFDMQVESFKEYVKNPARLFLQNEEYYMQYVIDRAIEQKIIKEKENNQEISLKKYLELHYPEFKIQLTDEDIHNMEYFSELNIDNNIEEIKFTNDYILYNGKEISFNGFLNKAINGIRKNINNNLDLGNKNTEILKEQASVNRIEKVFNEMLISNETNPYSFFVKDTAEFEMFEEFETITGLTAKEAISEYKKLRETGLAAGIGINIPSDTTFDDPKGLGTTILVRENGIDTFDIYGDSFIVDLKENNEKSQNRISAYKELYNAAKEQGLNVKEPTFLFEKERELGLPNNLSDSLKIEIPRVLNYFGSKYELFYDSYPVDGQIIHNNNVYDKENVLKLEKELFLLFDSQMKENEIFKTFVQNAAKERGDIFSSDRECAALLMTIKEIGLEKELGFEIPELKRNEIATLLQIELNQSKITEKEIINRVEKGKNLVKSYFFEHWKDDKEKGVFDLWATHDAMRYVGFNLEIQNYQNGKYVDVYNQEEKKELEKINQTMKNLLNEYSSELIERMNNNSNKFLFIFEKLQAAGIEVVFNKEEFDRILEREKLLQKMAESKSEKYLNTDDVKLLNDMGYISYFSFDVEDEKKFINHIDDWQKDNTNPLKMIIVGKVPPVMKVLGISEKLIEIEQSTLDKMLRDEPIYPNDKQGHKLSLDDIYAIPSQLADPVMVFKSRTRDDSYVFFTERKDLENRSILIPLAVDKKKGRLVIHEITSMYGRNNEVDFVKTNIDENNLIYEDRKRSCLWANEKVEELKKRSSNGERFTQIQFLGQRFTDNGTYVFNILTKERLVNFLNGINGKNTQNFITQDGRTYGFAHEGKIYLNPDIISSEVAIHEYTHLWDNYTKVTNPELWNKGKEVFKNTYLWEEVKNDVHYQDISHDEDLILSECHARITGKIADKILDKIQKENGEFTKDTIINWDKEVFEYISKEFVDKDIDIQSVSGFVSQTMKDFMEGRVMPKIDSYRINHNHDYFLSQKAIEFRIKQAKALTKAFFVENWEQSSKDEFVQKAMEYTLEPNSTVLFDKYLKEKEVEVYTKEEQEKMEQANNSIKEIVEQYSKELFETYNQKEKLNKFWSEADVVDTVPDGWKIDQGVTTVPNGYVAITNGKSRFADGEKRETKLIREENYKQTELELDFGLIPMMPKIELKEPEKQIIKEEVKLPFSIINNVEKGRVNIKFDQKISDKKFNSILKELKSAGWRFSSLNKQWYPVGNAVEKSESFIRELQEKYSKTEETITYATASFEDFSQTITESQIQKSPYDGIKFFDRNYKEIDEFVAYFNRNLDTFGKDVEPIDEKIAETIFESLQVDRSGTLNSRSIRLGLDASDNLILLNKEKSEIETKQISLKELFSLAKETLEKEKQSLDEMLENFNKKDNKEQFISVFGNLFQSAKKNNNELINKMKIIYEAYIKEPTEHTKKISKIDLYPVTKYNFKNKLKQICEIDKHFNHDVLIMGKQLLSLATEDDKKEISKWLKDDIGCEDEESMKKLFTKWISEKEIKQEKKKDGYPPRGE